MQPDTTKPETTEFFSSLDYNESIVAALSTIHQSLVQFSVMADSKANIMITVCSILLGLAIAKIEQGILFIPLLMFVACCVPALIFAILTVLPAAAPRHGKIADVQNLPHFNPLFFLHFSLVPLQVFQRELDRMLSDPQKMYEGLSRDIYYAGVAVGTKKFRYLRWSYISLLVGISFGGASIIISLLL